MQVILADNQAIYRTGIAQAAAPLFVRHDGQAEVKQHIIARVGIKLYIITFYIAMPYAGLMTMHEGAG